MKTDGKSEDERLVFVEGDRKINRSLEEMGAKWDRDRGGWLVKKSQLERVQARQNNQRKPDERVHQRRPESERPPMQEVEKDVPKVDKPVMEKPKVTRQSRPSVSKDMPEKTPVPKPRQLSNKRYHREYSDSDVSSEDVDETYKIYRAHAKAPSKFRDELNISSDSDSDDHVEQSTEESSDDSSDSFSSSDDDFPSPSTPRAGSYSKDNKTSVCL